MDDPPKVVVVVVSSAGLQFAIRGGNTKQIRSSTTSVWDRALQEPAIIDLPHHHEAMIMFLIAIESHS